MLTHIMVRGAREHNLKGFDVALPRDSLIVITGLSGSGKSSLAFDTIYAEGQRRYVESLSAYARLADPLVHYLQMCKLWSVQVTPHNSPSGLSIGAGHSGSLAPPDKKSATRADEPSKSPSRPAFPRRSTSGRMRGWLTQYRGSRRRH